MSNRAIFLDRDGTLNEEIGFITDPAQFRLYDEAAEAVRLINEQGWCAIVVTNQSGIARRLYSESLLDEVHETMRWTLQQRGARIDAIYYCPHHPDVDEPPYLSDCACRKPKPGMLLRAAREFDLELAACAVIGDRYSDVALAHAVGARGILLLTGHGQTEWETARAGWPREPDYVAKTVLDAVQWIFNHPR
jgi:D-glycero-D-manno-heptose 1,7-bisphosphate phosphatase